MANKPELIEVDLFADHPQTYNTAKRHKKSKKHKKQKSDYDSTEAVDVGSDIPFASMDLDTTGSSSEMSAADKLKSQAATVATTTSTNISVVAAASTTVAATTPPTSTTPTPTAASTTTPTTSTTNTSNNSGTPKLASSSKAPKKKKGRKESGTSSEEERWLDAIESGKLEQVDDELKKIKDPKLMTARQRAMYERGNDKEPFGGTELLMSLPTGYKEKVMTAEAIQKAQIKSQKRKQLADEKREKDKKKTMDRLLKKQDSKSGKNAKSKQIRATVPMISYRNTADGQTLLTFPPMVDFPLVAQTVGDPPKPTLCAMCSNIKKYNCSKTNLPLCSFKCYKMNVASLKQIIC